MLTRNDAPLCEVETESGRKVRVYNSFFNFPNDPFTVYWVAVDEDGNYGFLVDGKALVFHKLGGFSEFIRYIGDISWLENLRAISNGRCYE